MRVYVNGEERQLTVYDRIAGVEYAKHIVCAQDRLDTDAYGAFTMSEEEYAYWQHILAVQQDSEDIRLALQHQVDTEELNTYVYEETKYVTETKSIIEMENLSLKEIQQAVRTQDTAWLHENGFEKTLKK